jgi:hypothetical protein
MPLNKVTKGKETNLWWKMYWPKKVSTESKSKTIRKPFCFRVGDSQNHICTEYICKRIRRKMNW